MRMPAWRITATEAATMKIFRYASTGASVSSASHPALFFAVRGLAGVERGFDRPPLALGEFFSLFGELPGALLQLAGAPLQRVHAFLGAFAQVLAGLFPRARRKQQRNHRAQSEARQEISEFRPSVFRHSSPPQNLSQTSRFR